MGETIVIGPDGPCILANRLVDRLRRDGLLEAGLSKTESRTKTDMIIEALADEIHRDVVDGTLRKGG